MTAAAIWLRGPAGHQDVADQLPGLERFTAHHGYEVTQTYTVSETAWNGGQDAGEYKRVLQRALDDARAGRFKVLIVWALDRITQDGAEGALRIIRQFRERGCTVVSVQEGWLSGAPEVQDVLVAFAGWMAQQESTRRSERIKAGLARRLAEGKPVGRQPGSGDKKPRQRSGYVARWERERAAAGEKKPHSRAHAIRADQRGALRTRRSATATRIAWPLCASGPVPGCSGRGPEVCGGSGI